MVNQQDQTLQAYLMTQQLPDQIFDGNVLSDCLLKLQSRAPSLLCNISCGDQTLRSSANVAIRLTMVPSPIEAHFLLELHLYPPPAQATKQQLDLHARNRLYATFSTYEDGDEDKFPQRQRYEYKSNFGNTPPNGPVSFSGQLYDVKYGTGEHEDVSRGMLFGNVESPKQIFCSWRAKRCAKFLFSIDTAHMDAERQAAAKAFTEMVRAMGSNNRTMRVVAKGNNLVSMVYWPWFCALPAPVPESYFPWLHRLKPGHPLDIMEFRANGEFELWTAWIDRALAIRPKGWVKNSDVKKLPADYQLAKFGTATRFRDGREYLTHVLGCYGYEEVFAKGNLARYYNGEHRCDVFTGTDAKVRRYVILLNIRPPKRSVSSEAAEGQGLPEEGEKVSINIQLNNMTQTWTGVTVRIPAQYLKHGRNVAIVAEPKATTPQTGFVLGQTTTTTASFHFGHHGSPTTPTIERLIHLMTDNLVANGQPVQGAGWLKTVLLAQDLPGVAKTTTSTNLPPSFKDVVTKICNRRGLNNIQIAIVQHHFTLRITVVRGPPGTGKSTLIDAVVEIEEQLGQKSWICTDSNAACDVLVTKLCKRLQTLHPPGFLRIKPAFEEDLTFRIGQDKQAQITPTLEKPPQVQGSTVQETIELFLQHQENAQRAMSLEATIHQRSNSVHVLGQDPSTQKFDGERDLLLETVSAFRAFRELKLEGKSPQEYEERFQQLERTYYRVLRKIQQNYATAAKGLFTTAAAASGPFLRKIKPNVLIMDEASQFLEAKAVSAIVHALSGGKLSRVLLVGDDNQLPPTLAAGRNPFAATGTVSLFERLIKAGMPCLMLREQYRMHPHISSTVNREIYSKLGGLIDAPSTSVQDGVERFREFVKKLANTCGKAVFPNANAAVISPARDPSLSWTAQTPHGSTSKYNFVTARLVVQLVYRLIATGGFKAKDIKVIAFYSDQVQLLEALMADITNLSELDISSVDKSQGSERKVVILDLVVLGDANQDGMGFLNQDPRRWNVGMSRAQIGRITIAHRDMIKKVKGKEVNAGPWNGFLKEAVDGGTIIDGAKLNDKLEQASLQTKFVDVVKTWAEKTKLNGTKPAIHRNKAANTATPAVIKRDQAYEITAFVVQTGTNEATANRYLGQSGGELHVAMNSYYREHGFVGDIEDV